MAKIFKIIPFVIVLLSCKISAQNHELDSLNLLLKTALDDTNKVNILNKISWEVMNSGDYKKTIEITNKALSLAEKIKFKKGIANAYNNLGNVYSDKGDLQEAVNYYDKALKIRKEIDDKKGISISYNNFGIIFEAQGNYLEALNSYFSSLKIKEEIKDKKGIAVSYNNIGSIYEKQGNHEEAIKYHLASLKIKEEIGNKKGIAFSYDNLGNIYSGRGNFDEALKNHLTSLKIRNEIGDKRGIASCYKNIGTDYLIQNKLKEAINNYVQSLEISQQIGDKLGIVSCYNHLGKIYTLENKLAQSRSFLTKGLSLSLELGTKEETREFYLNLSGLDSAQNNPKKSLENYKLFIVYRDSIINEENTKKAMQTNFKYEYEKKLSADSIKNLDEKKIKDAQIIAQTAEIKQEQIKRYVLYGGFLLVIIFTGFIFNRFKLTQKQNTIIEQQKSEVESQRELADNRRKIAEDQKQIIEIKNKEIIDSINYAKRIQNAMLTSDSYLKNSLSVANKNNEHYPYFILFKPKDIVSGDFYWFYKNENTLFYMTADCTGHGVPGGFMSMLGINLLNEIVIERGIHEPGQILNKLRDEIIKSLTTDEGYARDGMDAVLCKLDFENLTLDYASSNNSFYILRDNEILKQKPQKMPIGFSEDLKPFITQSFKLLKNDTIYTFTDGFADQFGGEKEKKFLYKQLEQKIIAFGETDLFQQKQILETTFQNWKGNLEQIDDVCLIAIKV